MQILLFGKLKEVIGKNHIDASEFTVGSVSDLREFLDNLNLAGPETFQPGNTLIAVNQEMAAEYYVIQAGDEVAIFPPVTGG